MAAHDGSSTWAPATHMRNPHWVLGSWLGSGQDLGTFFGGKPGDETWFSFQYNEKEINLLSSSLLNRSFAIGVFAVALMINEEMYHSFVHHSHSKAELMLSLSLCSGQLNHSCPLFPNCILSSC